jgi:hypothetical protein
LLLYNASEQGHTWPVRKISEAPGISEGTMNNLKKPLLQEVLRLPLKESREKHHHEL